MPPPMPPGPAPMARISCRRAATGAERRSSGAGRAVTAPGGGSGFAVDPKDRQGGRPAGRGPPLPHHSRHAAAVVGEGLQHRFAGGGGHQQVRPVARRQQEFVDGFGFGGPARVHAEQLQLLAVQPEPEIAGHAGVDDPPPLPFARAGGEERAALPVEQEQFTLPARHAFHRRHRGDVPGTVQGGVRDDQNPFRAYRDGLGIFDDDRPEEPARRSALRPCRGDAGGTSTRPAGGPAAAGSRSRRLAPGMTSTKTLSLLACGDTCRPWTCRLVGSSRPFTSRMASSSPGRRRRVGPGTVPL